MSNGQIGWIKLLTDFPMLLPVVIKPEVQKQASWESWCHWRSLHPRKQVISDQCFITHSAQQDPKWKGEFSRMWKKDYVVIGKRTHLRLVDLTELRRCLRYFKNHLPKAHSIVPESRFYLRLEVLDFLVLARDNLRTNSLKLFNQGYHSKSDAQNT